MGGWWAAQLYDSAILRGRAILDRLMTLLYCVDNQKIDPKWSPSFSEKNLLRLVSWSEAPEMHALHALTNNEVFALAKEYRDGLVHQERLASELHGDHLIGRTSDGESWIEQGIPSETQLTLVVEYYRQILVPAIHSTQSLIVRTLQASGVDPYETP